MPSTLPRPKESDTSALNFPDDSFVSAQLPLDSPPTNVEDAVEALRQHSPEKLRQARKHQRRALKALREGGYDALPDETREQLAQQFRTSLTALNEALETMGTNASDASLPSDSPDQSQASSLFQRLLGWLW